MAKKRSVSKTPSEFAALFFVKQDADRGPLLCGVLSQNRALDMVVEAPLDGFALLSLQTSKQETMQVLVSILTFADNESGEVANIPLFAIQETPGNGVTFEQTLLEVEKDAERVFVNGLVVHSECAFATEGMGEPFGWVECSVITDNPLVEAISDIPIEE